MLPRSYLSACLCFQNAATYLEEWLKFYLTLGVEHFHLYNNESTDDFRAVVDPYLRANIATLVDYPGRAVQQPIYDHCLKTYGAQTRWMMFCDDDEFLFPTADVSLPEALVAYEPFAGVAISWMLYGGAGFMRRPTGLVIENYTRRASLPDQHVKCVVDPEKVAGSALIGHQFQCRGSHVIVDENFETMSGPFRPRPTADVFRINHYMCKSREELVERRKRVQACTGAVSPLPIEEWLRLEATWNEVEDPIACRYLERIRRLEVG